MNQEKPKPDASGLSGAVAPGRVSEFLAELAHVPDVDPREALASYRAGAVVGRFELLRELGRGGFGVVFEALDRQLGRRVAFKAIRPGGRWSARLKEEWLRREAEAAAQLSHPNIVQLYDFGIGPGGPYLVLELLEGETLEDRLQRGPLPVLDAIRISIEMARALAHSHAAGVLHRDLKPSNVFLAESGAVKVLDFGLARVLGARHQAGGTPAYMAPEQWREEPEDARTDLFGAGAILYEMLTGRTPYALSGGRSLALDPGPAPVPRRPGLPRKLGALVSCAIAKRQADRPANAQIWLDGLLAAERALARAGRERARRVAYAGAIVLAAAAAGAGFHAWRQARAPPLAERVTVAVADFTNESGDAELDGLSGMLITSLEQSRRLAVLSRSRMIDVLRQLGREDAVRIDEALAREIGRRTGVRALLIGAIRRFDGTYSLELRALDPLQDVYLFGVQELGSGKASIPALIDGLSRQTRQQLREGEEDVRSSSVKVAEAVTPSIEAYQHDFLGLDCLERPSRHPSRPEECLGELRKAVEVDPAFALAWFHLSMVGWDELHAHPAARERREAIERALQFADRVPAKERTLMRAWKAHLDGDDERAVALCREVTSVFPDDKRALYVAGDILWHREDLAEAVPYLARVLKLDPTFEFALDHLSYSLAVMGRRDELAGWVRTWATMAPVPAVLRALVQGRLGLGEAPAAVATARRAVEAGTGEYGLMDLVRALLFQGDHAAVESELRARGPGLSLRERFFLAQAVAAQGRRSEALRMLDAAAKHPPDEEALRDVGFVRAMHLAGDGDVAGVRAEAEWLVRNGAAAMATRLATPLARLGDLPYARELADRAPRGSPSREISLAVLDWKEGRGAPARARLQALEGRFPVPRGGIAPAFLRAEVAAEEGLDAEVVEALRSLERLPFQGYWRSWAHPQGLYLLARSLERLGRREEARAEVDRLLRLWSRADPGLPLLEQARALKARLEGPPPGKTGGSPGPSRVDGGSPSGVNPK